MIKFELVLPKDLTPIDIRWLTIGCQDSIDEMSAVDQVKTAIEGSGGIFRIVGDAEGVVVLSRSPKGEGLEITCLAGKGLIRHFNAVHDQIIAVARSTGATFVDGYTKQQGLARLYKRLTSAKHAEYFIEDLVA